MGILFMENWINIKGYYGDYKISNFGRVKSFKNNNEKLLKFGICNSGYKMVNLSKNNINKNHMIHKLVYENFNNIELKGKLIVIDHIDNDKLNNNLENLQVITQRENSYKDKISKSGNYNVYLNCGNYLVRMRIDGIKKSFGTFKNIQDAIIKRDEVIKSLKYEK